MPVVGSLSPTPDALKSLVLGAYQDAAALAGAPWLPQPNSSSAAGTSLLGAAQAAALRSALLQCARNSGHNQAGIAQAIAQLASSLIEAGSGGGFGASKAGSASSAAVAAAAAAAVAAAALGGSGDPGPEAVDGNATPGQRAAALGTCLLLELFEHAGKDVRREVVALCHNRLIGAKVGGRLPCIGAGALGEKVCFSSEGGLKRKRHSPQLQCGRRDIELARPAGMPLWPVERPLLAGPCLQEEVAAPYVRVLALFVRRNQATISGELLLPASACLIRIFSESAQALLIFLRRSCCQNSWPFSWASL